MAVNSTSTDTAMLAVIRRSRIGVGIGTTRTTTTAATARGAAMVPIDRHRPPRPFGRIAENGSAMSGVCCRGAEDVHGWGS